MPYRTWRVLCCNARSHMHAALLQPPLFAHRFAQHTPQHYFRTQHVNRASNLLLLQSDCCQACLGDIPPYNTAQQLCHTPPGLYFAATDAATCMRRCSCAQLTCCSCASAANAPLLRSQLHHTRFTCSMSTEHHTCCRCSLLAFNLYWATPDHTSPQTPKTPVAAPGLYFAATHAATCMQRCCSCAQLTCCSCVGVPSSAHVMAGASGPGAHGECSAHAAMLSRAPAAAERQSLSTILCLRHSRETIRGMWSAAHTLQC
jgi:hypothetical protein